VIQLCKMKGIKVVGTVRRNDLNEELTRLGADAIVNTETDNLPATIKQLTEGKGVRAVLECVGGSTTEEATQCLGRGGVMLIYGLMSLSNPTLDIGLMIFKELNIKGFWLTDWMRRVDNGTRMKVAQEVITLLATGQITMPVEATYGLEQISEAITHAQATGRWGKILIKP
jgi:NADPH:quinone reductase-like Zn-dependent oxidoreductase